MTHGRDRHRPKPLDLRLPMAAVAAWLAGIWGWWFDGPWQLTLAIVLGPLISVTVWKARWHRHEPAHTLTATGAGGPSARVRKLMRACVPFVVFLTVATSAAVVVTGLAKDGRDLPDEVVGRIVDTDLLIVSGSKQLAAEHSWQQDRVQVRARLTRAAHWRVDVPVLIFGGTEWRDLPIGTHVRSRAKLLPTSGSLQTSPLVTSYGAPTTLAPPAGVQSRLNPFRRALSQAVAGAPDDGASLVQGLAIGDETRQSPDLAQAMQTSGLSHLTAVSGGNTAIVLLMAIGIARLVRWPPWAQAALGSAALLGYVLLVGPQPSVLRAAVMGTAVLVGLARGGLIGGLPVLALAALTLLLLDPAMAVSLGFALSVAATFGLLVIAPRIHRAMTAVPILRGLPRWFALAIAVTVAAQITTAPIVLGIGSDVSLASVPANLIVAPVVAPVTIAGLLAAVLGTVVPVLAGSVAWPAVILGQGIALVAYWTSGWDWASVSALWTAIPTPPGLALIAMVLGGWVLATSRGGRNRRVSALQFADSLRRISSRHRAVSVLLSTVLLATALAWRLNPQSSQSAPWVLVACDVGQGSATLLKSDSATLLVDTGPEDGQVIACLEQAGVVRLEAIVITHLHDDHTSGLDDVVAAVPVGAVYTTAADREADELTRLLAQTTDAPKLQLLQTGQAIELPGLSSQVIWPDLASSASGMGRNNGSVVLRTTWTDGLTALTTGDIEAEAQDAIAHSTPNSEPVDILTVPHHGSANQDDDFIRRSSPAVALFSAGRQNDYGHPTASSLAAYRSSGSIVGRTDQSGTIRVDRNGDQLTLSELG